MIDQLFLSQIKFYHFSKQIALDSLEKDIFLLK